MIKIPLPFRFNSLTSLKGLLDAFRSYTRRPNIRVSILSSFQTLAAIVIGLIFGAGLILMVGANPIEAYGALFKGAFGSWPAIARTLRTASPVIFTGMAVVVSFRAGFIYLGMEGSLYFGALGGALFGIYLTQYFPSFLHLPISLLAGTLAGALWAIIPAFLRAYWKVDEVVSTLMLNYIGILLVDHLVYTYFQDIRDGSSAERAFTLAVPETARLPFISEKFGLTFSVVLGVILALIFVWVYARSVWGFESDMTGFNRRFAHYGGINITRMAVVSMVLAGAIAGLGGASESLGSYGRYISGFSTDFGFSGVTVALMGRLNPLGTIVASIFFGGLTSGGASMELMVNVPRDMVVVVQGLILLVVTAQSLFAILKLGVKSRPEE